MCEYQLFCHAENIGRDYSDSYQQKPYRVFNVQVTEDEYKNIKIPRITLKFDSKESYASRYQTAFKKAWSEATPELQQQFLDIPHFNAVIFEKITGVRIETDEKDSEIIELNGKKYKLID
jgi:hypothetical protein